MKELYLEVFSNVSDSGICFVPLETVIALFVYEYCGSPPLLVTLVSRPRAEDRFGFKIELPKVPFEILEGDDIEAPGNLCKLPLLVMNERTTCIAGLCAVLRQIMKIVDRSHPLLGFKQSCLYACAEASVWTRFCEVDIVQSVNDLFLTTHVPGEDVVVPADVLRFEAHMGKPVKTHNIQKQKQMLARRNGNLSQSRLPDSRLDLLQELDHTYCEGHQMSLADLILLPCFHFVFESIGSPRLSGHLPLSHAWYRNLMDNETVERSIRFVSDVERKWESDGNVNYSLPEIPKDSLYKSESGTSRSKRQLYTKQEAVETSFETVGNITDDLIWEQSAFGHEMEFDWATVPIGVQLEGSEFPEKRLQRKAEQLENMTKAVLKVAKGGDRIVDFCSGSGHLGLVLAYSMPNCVVVLLENKEESLGRARERAHHLKLRNLVFCQSNIHYFEGDFDVGVSLHACGVATDLVMEKCLNRGASFVCCPCCYGSIRPNHLIEYPRSQRYRDSRLTVSDYLTLAHSSDQTHDESNRKTSQGKKCMAIIDTDRCLRARETGYSVSISTMEPSSCTPKNNLLVGISPRHR